MARYRWVYGRAHGNFADAAHGAKYIPDQIAQHSSVAGRVEPCADHTDLAERKPFAEDFGAYRSIVRKINPPIAAAQTSTKKVIAAQIV